MDIPRLVGLVVGGSRGGDDCVRLSHAALVSNSRQSKSLHGREQTGAPARHGAPVTTRRERCRPDPQSRYFVTLVTSRCQYFLLPRRCLQHPHEDINKLPDLGSMSVQRTGRKRMERKSRSWLAPNSLRRTRGATLSNRSERNRIWKVMAAPDDFTCHPFSCVRRAWGRESSAKSGPGWRFCEAPPRRRGSCRLLPCLERRWGTSTGPAHREVS